jgi:hypothetical protein
VAGLGCGPACQQFVSRQGNNRRNQAVWNRNQAVWNPSDALRDAQWGLITALSRWRHGFESRWGCKEMCWSALFRVGDGSAVCVVCQQFVGSRAVDIRPWRRFSFARVRRHGSCSFRGASCSQPFAEKRVDDPVSGEAGGVADDFAVGEEGCEGAGGTATAGVPAGLGVQPTPIVGDAG